MDVEHKVYQLWYDVSEKWQHGTALCWTTSEVNIPPTLRKSYSFFTRARCYGTIPESEPAEESTRQNFH